MPQMLSHDGWRKRRGSCFWRMRRFSECPAGYQARSCKRIMNVALSSGQTLLAPNPNYYFCYGSTSGHSSNILYWCATNLTAPTNVITCFLLPWFFLLMSPNLQLVSAFHLIRIPMISRLTRPYRAASRTIPSPRGIAITFLTTALFK